MIEPEDLPTVSWDYVYGTNLQHGLILARKMLAHQPGTKQIILVTDGEPTAHIVPYDGGVGYDVFFNYPPIPETLEVTLAEVMRCTRAGHHHQHFPARPGPGAVGLRRPAQPGSTGVGPSPRRRTSWATTCWSISSATRRPSAPAVAAPAEGAVRPGAPRRSRPHRFAQ